MENNLLTSELKGQRTLATVVFTDCVGFSARMSVDEDHTLDLIRRDLKLMKHVCEQLYEGRVLKSTGDGLLMCFISAVKAVEYAIEIQKQLLEKAAKLPPEDFLQHRIGIHLADIFINETDVMGNGVNIAARLQTLAEPGGICISQTVYDVVKAGMQLSTRYLGPQELKNIREVVPTYKVILDPNADSADPYIEAIQSLEQNKNFIRIKKLLVYACKNTWESDLNRLSAIDLRELLQEILKLAPTPEQLQHLLDVAVKTLSKPAEYSLVAEAIVEEVNKLCFNLQQAQPNSSHSQPATDAILPLHSSTGGLAPLYERVTEELEKTGNQIRIRKLIYYICRRRWENDPGQLNSVHLQDLVAELYELVPTPEQLNNTLNEFIQTLSKQAEYVLVGNIIVSKFQLLYAAAKAANSASTNQSQEPLEDETILNLAKAASLLNDREKAVYSEIAATLEQDPNVNRIKKLILFVCRRQWESDPAKLNQINFSALLQELHQLTQTREQLESALGAVAKSLNKREEYEAIAHTIVSQMSRLYADHQGLESEPALETASTQSIVPAIASFEGVSPTPPPNELEEDDLLNNPVAISSIETPLDNPQKPFTSLFDYRLGIMKYANPLRAKILIFSALHSDFGYSDQDWRNLKTHELDGLMRQLLKNCKFYTELEALLYGAARRLKEPEENVQTATAIIRCLRPLYLNKNSAQEIRNVAEEVRLSLEDFEEMSAEIAQTSDEDESTCRLLTSTHALSCSTEPLKGITD